MGLDRPYVNMGSMVDVWAMAEVRVGGAGADLY